MLYFLYGEDTYRSRKKLHEIIEEYRGKAGSDLNLHRFDGGEGNLSEFRRITETPSLFHAKKLVVVEYAFSEPAEFPIIRGVVERIQGDRETIVILWDRALDSSAEKRLKEIAPYLDKVQEFKPLSRESLTRWIHEEAKKRSLKLYPAHLVHLASFGNDLWALSNELDKLEINQLTVFNPQPTTERTIFHLGDTFFSSHKEAFHNLLHLLHQGHDAFNLFSYLANHARTLLMVKSHEEKRRIIPASFGIHPYVVRKASVIVRPIPQYHFASLLHRFFEEDIKIKIGTSHPRDSLLDILIGAQKKIPA